MALADILQAVQKRFTFSKEVEFDGIKFEIAVLSFEQEMKTDSLFSSDDDTFSYYNQVRLQTLSYAVKGINGETIPEVVEEGETKIQGNLYVKKILSSLPVKLVEQLFDVYVDLKEESESSLNNALKYNWFKSPETRAEERNKIVEDAKNEPKKKEDNPEDSIPEVTLREVRVPAEANKEPSV